MTWVIAGWICKTQHGQNLSKVSSFGYCADDDQFDKKCTRSGKEEGNPYFWPCFI